MFDVKPQLGFSPIESDKDETDELRKSCHVVNVKLERLLKCDEHSTGPCMKNIQALSATNSFEPCFLATAARLNHHTEYTALRITISPVDSNEALVARIAVVAGDIREIPGVFANVRQYQHWWFEACIFPGRRSFEQFL
ncbi:hypothetical protein TNCV_4174561 [Trichonephila clavipes]|nr:hypothetical protein TNCV_4174561 [Trichonephila clavipes]